MSSQTLDECKGCERDVKNVFACPTRTLQFSVHNQKCPRELALAEKIKEVTTPKVKPFSLEASSSEISTANLRLKDVKLGIFTPRMAINQKWVQDLAEDIKNNGQQKAVIVQYRPEPPYPVIDGEHRIAALKLLQQPLVRAEIRPLSDEESAFLAMKINEMHGLRLDDLERGKQLYKLQEKFGWTQEKLGKMFGRGQPWVSYRINLYLKTSSELKSNIIARAIMFSQAREIAQLPEEDQPEVVEKVKEAKLTSRTTKVLVQALKDAETPEAKQQILEKPIKSYQNLYEEPEAIKRALAAKPDDVVFQVLTCPICGNKIAIDWNSREATWEGEPEE